jgi:hypothetical protein
VQGAVDLAIEHVLVANQAEHVGRLGERGEKPLAGAVKGVGLFGLGDLVLEFPEVTAQGADDSGHQLGELFLELGLGEVEQVEDVGAAEIVGGLLEFAGLVGGALVERPGDQLGQAAFEQQVLLGFAEFLAQLEEGLGVLVGGLQGGTDGAEFESLGAAEAPVGGGDALDEGFLDQATGLELGQQVVEDGVELGAVLGGVGGLEEVPGEQAVLEGVSAGAGLALRGTGAGGAAGVAAIGTKLQGGCHGGGSFCLPAPWRSRY